MEAASFFVTAVFQLSHDSFPQNAFLFTIQPIPYTRDANTVELHLSGIGTTSHPDNNRLHWQFEVEKKMLQTAVLGYTIFRYK
jgi:hypothetical protein